MERTSSRKKIAVIIAVTALLAVVLIATLAAEKWVTYNPTPVKSVTADELDSGAQPPLAIGSTENSPVKFSLPCGFYRMLSGYIIPRTAATPAPTVSATAKTASALKLTARVTAKSTL